MDFGSKWFVGTQRGFLLGMGLHALQIPLFMVLAVLGEQGSGSGLGGLLGLFSLVYIGSTQLVYLLPAIAFFARRDPDVVRGLCLAGIVTCIGNVECFFSLTSAELPL